MAGIRPASRGQIDLLKSPIRCPCPPIRDSIGSTAPVRDESGAQSSRLLRLPGWNHPVTGNRTQDESISRAPQVQPLIVSSAGYQGRAPSSYEGTGIGEPDLFG